MKWIKSRNKFLNEAKIRDLILRRQSEAVKDNWGEKYLDFEQIELTKKIVTGKWKLTEEDKRKVLGKFFTANLDNVYEIFEKLDDKFASTINNSIDLNLLKSDKKWEKILNNFDIKRPTINQISVLTDPIFRKISVSETLASELILRDETGRPVPGEDGRPQKVSKEPGELIYSKNLTNLNSFIEDFNRCFPEVKIDPNQFTSGDISRLVSKSREDFSGEGYQVEVDIYGRDMYLTILHNPQDILNMSISRFYSSCQNLYSGGHREQLLGNVFDPNSVPAFLMFDSSIHNSDGQHISDTLPVSRMIIRNIETFNPESKPLIFFDRAYPDRMKELFEEIIEKYTPNKKTVTSEDTEYIFSPDLPDEDASRLREPYQDRLSISRARYIGKNTKKITFSLNTNWSRTIINNPNLEEVTIETVNLPENFFELILKPNWIKFKFLKVNSASPFKNIKTGSLSFEKCLIDNDVIVDFINNFENVTKLQIINCRISGLNLSQIPNLEELHLLYTVKPQELGKVIENMNLKKLIISGDLVSENKPLISSLKKSGVKVEIKGPQIDLPSSKKSN